MALKQDDRALLQLLCERGQSYADLAELLGIPEGEVRGKARAALGELGGADPDAEVGLTDYLLGQADPIGRADAVRFLQQDPEARVLAGTIVTKLEALAPEAQLPSLPEPKGRKRKAASPTPAEAEAEASAPSIERSAPRSPRDPRQTRIVAGLIGGGVVLLFAILAIAGVFSSGDDDGSSDQASVAEQQREITPVDLKPVGGSGVAGVAKFGLANDQLFVDLEIDGLDPELGGNKAYVLWMMLNRNAGYPVTLIVPNANGSVQDRFAIPTPVAVVVGGAAQFVEVSESPAQELRKTINTAVDQGAPVVPFSGDSLARGRIPLAKGGQLPAPTDGGGGSGQSNGGSGGDGG